MAQLIHKEKEGKVRDAEECSVPVEKDGLDDNHRHLECLLPPQNSPKTSRLSGFQGSPVGTDILFHRCPDGVNVLPLAVYEGPSSSDEVPQVESHITYQHFCRRFGHYEPNSTGGTSGNNDDRGDYGNARMGNQQDEIEGTSQTEANLSGYLPELCQDDPSPSEEEEAQPSPRSQRVAQEDCMTSKDHTLDGWSDDCDLSGFLSGKNSDPKLVEMFATESSNTSQCRYHSSSDQRCDDFHPTPVGLDGRMECRTSGGILPNDRCITIGLGSSVIFQMLSTTINGIRPLEDCEVIEDQLIGTESTSAERPRSACVVDIGPIGKIRRFSRVS